jgi:hypothetical protein
MPKRHRAFEIFLREIRPFVILHHGESLAGEIIGATRVEYERVRPHVPDIGGARNVYQPVMIVNGWIVALHRAMNARGLAARDAVRVCHEAFDAWLKRIPGWLLHVIGRLMLSPLGRWYFERQARRSQERRYAEDFVWRVERGADGELAMVFEECAVNKWYEAEGVRELKPYCNFADVTYSRLMGMGVDANETIGLGCNQCALRFKHGRETVVPANLEGIVRSAST